MSNNNASEDNVESPSTYAEQGYKEYRMKEKNKNNNVSEDQHVESTISEDVD